MMTATQASIDVCHAAESRESGVGIHQPTCSARGELEETLNHEHKHKHKYKPMPAERKEGKKAYGLMRIEAKPRPLNLERSG